jgi:hypothetical protein
MAALDRSLYEEITIESIDRKRTVDLRTGVVSIDYYEDIFSPVITAKIRVVNSTDTVRAPDRQGNPDGLSQSIYNGLPLRGGERVSLKIKGNTSTNPGLNFTSAEKNLFVTSITDVFSESLRETFVLNLTSREAITNETVRVARKYPTSATIDVSVKDILATYLKTKSIGNIEKSKNKYGFIGNSRKPFTILIWLASKAVPSTDSPAAGFFFYQTKEGFQFRSIDGLIRQQSRATYIYTQVNESGIERNNDYFILKYSTDKNQNLIEKLRLGAFASERRYYNPLTFEFTKPEEGKFSVDTLSKKMKNLGKKVSDGLHIPEELKNSPSRIFSGILDLGTLEKDVQTTENANPLEYQSQSLIRYNLLLTQTLSVTIPSNTNLNAGDVITCKFPKISLGSNSEYDDQQSGLYMIKELCHHFDTEGSYTSLKLIRDTFGLYGTNNR